MDQNLPFTPTLNPLTTPSSTSNSFFSPVSSLFKKSWDRVQNHLLRLFLLAVTFFVSGIILLLLTALLISLAGFFSPVTTATTYSSTTTILAVVTFLIVIILMMIGMITLNIATIIVLAETQPGLSLMGTIKLATRKIGPMLIFGLLSGFVVFGGLVLLVIPGILFSILLTMSGYYIVLDNLSPIEAMRKSVYAVSKSFGVIFIRIAALFGLSFVAGIIINMLTSQSGLVWLLGSILSLIFNLIYGWVSIAFMMFVFQDSKKAAGEGRGKLLPMIIVAILGWMVIFGGGFLIIRAANQNNLPLTNDFPVNNSPLNLNNLQEKVTTPAASVRPSTSSASTKPTATPKPSASPKASAATSSASR